MLQNRPLPLPPLVRFPADLHGRATEYVKLLGRQAAAALELRSAEARRPEAVANDTSALAGAMRTGRKDPGQPATTAADVELTAARRQHAALTEALRLARAELVAAAEAQRGTWLAAIAARRIEANGRALELLAELASVLQERALLNADSEWLAALPVPRPYRGAQAMAVPGLRSPNGSPYFFADVLAALSAVFDPRTPDPAPVYKSEAFEVRSDRGDLLERGWRSVLVPAANADERRAPALTPAATVGGAT